MATDFNAYHQRLFRLATPALAVEPVDRTVARAVGAAALLLTDDAAGYDALVEGCQSLAATGRDADAAARRFTDQAHHHRPVYYPLVVYLHLAAFAARYESMPQPQWAVCENAADDMVRPMRIVETYTDTPPAPELIDITLWQTLCLYQQAALAQRDSDIELTDAVVHQIITRPGRDGALHAYDPDESLDTWTYRELVALHALGNLALLRRNRTWAARVQQVAMYHLQNTQPDHVTNQPWAVFAFAWSAQTRSFADQQLHDAATHGQGKVGTLAALLLADAASCMALFMT